MNINNTSSTMQITSHGFDPRTKNMTIHLLTNRLSIRCDRNIKNKQKTDRRMNSKKKVSITLYNFRTSSGFWWRSGCKRTSGNSSFSVCECEQLSSFVVLSSNEDFPSMGEHVGLAHQDVLLHLNIARGGMIISVVFLLITLTSLILFRLVNITT